MARVRVAPITPRLLMESMKSQTLLLAVFALGAVGLAACAGSEREGAPSPVASPEADAAFDVVYSVLQHPRCVNCHPAGDRPLQFDDGRPHAMNVVRGDDDRGLAGMRCAGCHGGANLPVPHTPPGVASGWRLAPREMVFEGLSKQELAGMLLDPERSHMTPEQLVEHVERDSLVHWGWDPGPGREPVPVAHADFVAAFRTWIEAGAPVPEE